MIFLEFSSQSTLDHLFFLPHEVTNMSQDVAAASTPSTDGIQYTKVSEDDNCQSRESKAELEPDDQDVSLHPTDHGFHAWAYLMSAWVLDLLIWGLPFTYGVFLDFYKTEVFPAASPGLIALPGSLCNGILYLSTIYIMPLISRFPMYKFQVMIVGYVICISGLVGAAFATKVEHLVVTQGVLYAVGGGLLYYPMMTYLFEWFVVRKGFAYGVLFSGASIGGVVMPFIIRPLLDRYGRKVTLIALGISFSVFILPCFPYLKPRIPPQRHGRSRNVVESKRFDTQFLRGSVFWILFMTSLIQSSGAFMPFLYLPVFTTDLNLKSVFGTLSVALVNGVSGPGMIFFGHLTDHYDLQYAILLSSLGSAISVFLIWGFSQSLTPVIVFSCVYGFLGPPWAAMFPKFAEVTVGERNQQLAPTLVFFYLGARGIGNVLSSPLSAALISPWELTDKVPYGYGLKGYFATVRPNFLFYFQGPLIIFTGVSLLTSSLAVFHCYLNVMVPLDSS
ncbi:MFS general substrate transporter [Marasmius fiardii PR-910]|nr:MFS general substrate transporter [Marasmius fiardii PR-910]